MKLISVDENYQSGYSYNTSEPVGQNYNEDFNPELTPAQMLELGVFGGNYFKSRPKEFPAEWFKNVEFSKIGASD